MSMSTRMNMLISIIALVLSFCIFISDCRQNKVINDLQYNANSVNYKPIIKIDSVLLTSFLESLNFYTNSTKSDTAVNVISNIKTDVTFYIENIGNSNAKIIGVLITDTVSGASKLRELIYKSDLSITEDTFSNKKFYDYWQLQPLHKDVIKFNKKSIDFVNNKSFTLHLILFYENELGILYDTYYWARFQKNDIVLDIFTDPNTGKIMKSNIVNGNNPYIKFADSNIAYKIYTIEEKEKCLKALEKLEDDK